ncbi:MAG: hypothetical protein OXG51_13535 [Gammaproteobacteria bacterium]|nr:hypothetical protein [Gammaproteobacteria bacterium]MCY3795376.1 hypothetical protein [Gammaproteobacteria bacterium]
MNGLKAAWERVRSELAANLRLRLGAWAVAFIVLFYAVLVQGDRVAAAYDEYADGADRFARAERLRGQGEWSELLAAEQERNEQLSALFWEAETQGLAEASLQAALQELLRPLEFRNMRIQSGVSQPVPDVPGLWQIQAQVNAGYRQGAELQLLHKIATHPRKLVVNRLDLVPQNRRLLLIVSAYFTGIPTESE